MRLSKHNGRSGSHGTYNPKHNDRQFDVERADGVKEDMTPSNIYWNCIDDRIVNHRDLGENDLSFVEAEKRFYEITYGDYLTNQNKRHIATRHKERCRTMDQLREDPKTCPEETIYQIGNMDEYADPKKLAMVAYDYFEEHRKRYGDHVHILNWALHLDESTPHIHERHVFDVVNKYGERCPKQEQACREMGFLLPDPDKKPGRFNNRKMSYDRECRQLLMEICKKHGLEIEEEPVYGGRAYMEKQDYIVDKLNTKAADMQEMLNDTQAFIDEMADKTYEKACEIIIDRVAEETAKENFLQLDKVSTLILSDNCKAPAASKQFGQKVIKAIQSRLEQAKDRIISAVRKALDLPEVKKTFKKELAREIKPSIHDLLKKAKGRVADYDRMRTKENEITERKHNTYEREL